MGHLRNPLLRERHWQAITNLLGHTIDRTEGAATSIQQLLNLQVCFLCLCGAAVKRSTRSTPPSWGLATEQLWHLLSPLNPVRSAHL